MSDPANDGYQCHGPMRCIISDEHFRPLGYICASCGVTKNMARDPGKRVEVDRVLYGAARVMFELKVVGKARIELA